ncbi:flagellar biosynthetic protein FliR [Paenibacillus sp. MMS18-CY102]|uniref:flagellar biosynthetic protein FliR n=1 Tax=Paenibacillus sp. MMS18-CY102 TaxID=2682849 RepID=UPI001365F319|nr:flagellar biosynthetic protein FliR [Paenibacillus sp. MMS18-CY102]MWC26553.1 flagellar type III secretion system protein FliR [Paenibacillus sp. MMS18-CY102]
MELIAQGFPIFLLIFCRMTAFFVVAPIFSMRGVPTTFKIGLGFFLTLIVFLTYGVKESIVPDATYILFVIREVLVGLLLGFVVYLFFTVVQTAGALMDLSMGFAMSNVVDPMTGASSPMMGNLKYMILVLVFLSMNGHHYLLTALMDSYKWMPLDNDLFAKIYSGDVSNFMALAFTETFMLAFQIASPIIVAMFLTDVGLGFLAKTAPQYNVFVIGMPLKILIGIVMLTLILPSMSGVFEHLFTNMFEHLQQLLTMLQRKEAS